MGGPFVRSPHRERDRTCLPGPLSRVKPNWNLEGLSAETWLFMSLCPLCVIQHVWHCLGLFLVYNGKMGHLQFVSVLPGPAWEVLYYPLGLLSLKMLEHAKGAKNIGDCLCMSDRYVGLLGTSSRG